MKTKLQLYKGDDDTRIRNTPKNIDAGQYIYYDREPVTTSAENCLATESNNKLLSVKTGTSRIIQILPTTVTTDKDSIRNTVSVYRATVAPTLKQRPIEDKITQGHETEDEQKDMCAENT